jgi:membrane protein DedA with SNARE-associated domain
VIEKLLEIFRSIPAPLVILAALLLPAAETALLLGLLVPGELAVVAAGLYASGGGVPLAAVMVAAVVGSIAGDSIGFFVGRRFRTTISHRLSAKRWQRAQEWLKRKGMPAIFLARFTPFLRSVMPPAAGAAKVRYRVFLLWSVPAGILWGAGSALLGYYAARTSGALHWAAGIAFVLLLAFLVATWASPKRRRARRAARASSAR